MKRPRVVIMLPCLLLLAVAAAAGCGGGSDGQAGGGGTFTMAIAQDPGNLDPNQSNLLAAKRVANFGYDKLVHFTNDGTAVPWLAESWKVTPTTVTFTIREGVTCVDGAPFDAAAVAANFTHSGDPENESVLLGGEVQEGTTATADTKTHTVTVKVPEADPFLLMNLGGINMVCPKGLENPSALRTATNGTGMFKLTEAVAGDHYTFVKRDGYTWGPYDSTSSSAGVPDNVTLKVVGNMSTAANLLLSGEVNAAAISGPDLERVEKRDFFASKTDNLAGELWFNQRDGRPGTDVAVRKALTMGLDLSDVRTALTDGRGTPATSLTTNAPVACPGDTVKGHLPEHDPAGAGDLLDEAGWRRGADGVRTKNGKRLELTHVYIASESSNAAAELVRKAWVDLGIDVTLSAVSDTQVNTIMFETGKWDTLDLTAQWSLPTELVPVMAGSPPPDGQNFAGLDNKSYTERVEKAQRGTGKKTCADWNAAQVALLENVDVVPYAAKVAKILGNGASWDESGVIPPTIRMRK